MGTSPSIHDNEIEDITAFVSNNSQAVDGKKTGGREQIQRSNVEIVENDNEKDKIYGLLGKHVNREFTLIEPSDFKKFRHKNKINQILIDEKHGVIWSCSLDKTIVAWDIKTGDCKKVFCGHKQGVTCLQLHDSLLYSGSFDRTVRAWDVETGECKQIFDQNTNWITCLTVANGFLYCSDYDVIHVYDVKTGKKVNSLRGHRKCIISLATSDRTGILYSASTDGTVRAWDMGTGECLHMYVCREKALGVGIFNNILLCAYHDEVYCWDVENYESVDPFVGVSNFIIHDGKLIGWNRNHKKFEMWDIQKHTLLHAIEGENLLTITGIAYSDGVLYYTTGSSITSKKFDYVEIELTEEKVPKKEMQKKRKKINNAYQPTYLQYRELFNYFVEILLHPPTKIAMIIDKLHQKKILQNCKNFDAQITAVSDMLSEYRSSIIFGMSLPSKKKIDKKIDFEIMVNPYGDKNHYDRRKQTVYTQDELSQDFETRTEIFYKKIRAHSTDIQPKIIYVRRNDLVLDALKQFTEMKKKDLMRPMYVYIAEEEGLDMGGVTREFYQLLSEKILDEKYALFLRTGVNYTYHPNPASAINEAHLLYFKFIGRLIGKAIFDMNMMQTHFTPVIFKLMVGKPIVFEDLEYVDPSMFLAMRTILNSDDVSIMDLTFTAEENDFGKNNIYPLIENGEDIPVTEENKYKFVTMYSQWKMIESVRPQIEKLLDGLYEIIPRDYFTIFSEKELELLLCGKPNIDLDDWKRNVKYEGYEKDEECIQNFWRIVEDFTHVQKSKLLQFVTGSACVPPEGFEGFRPPFTICKIRMSSEFLPRAHTCFNRLDLPEYPSINVCKQRLLQAIEYGLSGFHLT